METGFQSLKVALLENGLQTCILFKRHNLHFKVNGENNSFLLLRLTKHN